MTEPAAYEMAREDHEAVNEAFEWFLGTLKPRTAGEVRSVLVQLYLKGMCRGIQHTKSILEEVSSELS